jgi:TolA-binding protein
VTVKAASGDALKQDLTETLPHSGIFTANLEPKFVGEKGADGKPAQPDAKDDVLSVAFGDQVTFGYSDDLSLESMSPVTVGKRAKVLHGSDGRLAAFTKRFKDPEIAVKTRFLMAESLFEMAKEHRKLGQKDVAEEEISRGKGILEEAIRDYPDTSLAVQGEYLLANLAQELGNFQEAVGRYSNVISSWPESEYAAPSQFKKALCFEKLQNYDQACEEYVKLTYIYPDNALVADATVRLGNYYYKKQSYKIAGKIFYNFREKNPAHKLAAEALFLAAQCEYKQADYREAGKRFGKVVEEYPDEKEVRAEAMYWLADSTFKGGDAVKAYQTFKKLTWDYPDSKWAKTARGRLTEEVFSRMAEDEQ